MPRPPARPCLGLDYPGVSWRLRETTSNEAVKLDPGSQDEEPNVPEPLAEGESEVAGLLDRPFAGGVGRVAEFQMHPASFMLDEHQDVQSLQQHGVHVEEVDGEDPGGLSVRDCPPRRACATGSRIDGRGRQYLPDGRQRDGHAEFRHFAVDPAVSPRGFSFASRMIRRAMLRNRRRPTERPLPARVVLLRGQLAVPGERCRRSSIAGETFSSSG